MRYIIDRLRSVVCGMGGGANCVLDALVLGQRPKRAACARPQTAVSDPQDPLLSPLLNFNRLETGNTLRAIKAVADKLMTESRPKVAALRATKQRIARWTNGYCQ